METMWQNLGIGSVLVLAGLLSGCVERRSFITSEPLGATVFHNGQPIGATPVDDYFIYYGDQEYTLVKDGYETLRVRQPVPAPWYEYPLVDFISENLIPWKIRDVRRFPTHQLQPLQTPRGDQVLSRAQDLRGRGQTLGPPRPPGADTPGSPLTPARKPLEGPSPMPPASDL